MNNLRSALLIVAVALNAGLAFAQAPSAAPDVKLPAMPSLEQKGSDDMSKPAGAEKPPAVEAKAPPAKSGKAATKTVKAKGRVGAKGKAHVTKTTKHQKPPHASSKHGAVPHPATKKHKAKPK